MGIYFLMRAKKFFGAKGEGLKNVPYETVTIIYKSTSICDCQRQLKNIVIIWEAV